MEGTRFQAVFYRAPDGSEPVAAHIASHTIRTQAILDQQIDRLNDLGPSNPHLPHPWSSHVRGELRELRCHVGSELHRILYCRSDGLFILLHAFVKRSRKLPEDEIAVAERRWRDFKERMDRVPRQPPRPAGHDAPRRTR